ncbi:MAG: hypothetical protein AAFO04_27245 [Cyanobacteria bacterium J06592_8]
MTTTITQRPSRSAKRGRIFETEVPPQQLEYEQKRIQLRQRARIHFERLKFELISSYPNDYVCIEPETGVYLIDEDFEALLYRASIYFPRSLTCIFGINETGTCGRL